MPRSQKGFLIMDVLIAASILAVAFTVFLSAITQALRVSSRSSQTTDAISRFEPFLFEIESGLRADLASGGGKGDLEENYHYAIEKIKDDVFNSLLKNRLSWKNDREHLELQIKVLKAPVQ